MDMQKSEYSRREIAKFRAALRHDRKLRELMVAVAGSPGRRKVRYPDVTWRPHKDNEVKATRMFLPEQPLIAARRRQYDAKVQGRRTR